MKTLIKKLYCEKCQRLVTGKEQIANGTSRITCSRCGKLLRTGDGIYWLGTHETL